LARLRGGLLQARPLPIPGQELIDPLGWMILQSRQDIGEPCPRIDVIELGGLDQRVDGGGAPAAFVRRGLIVPGFPRRKSRSPIRFIR
jgi:hypothetical protein